jgi:hypothetical protein
MGSFFLRHFSRPFAGSLVPRWSEYWGLASATNPELFPKAKPWTMRKHLVVPAIGGRDVACAERPNVRRFEHFLQLLDLVNCAFNVHAVSISNMSVAIVKPTCIGCLIKKQIHCILIRRRTFLKVDYRAKRRAESSAAMPTFRQFGHAVSLNVWNPVCTRVRQVPQPCVTTDPH